MIGYIHGTVSHILIDYCFIDVQGVGYRVFITTSTRTKLLVGQEATLFTYLNIREDAMQLYGFPTQSEYDLFLQLISVAGIGPKVALGIMSAIAVDRLCTAIHQKNIPVLTKLPGIGKKTAERLILELYDKMASVTSPSNVTDAPEIADSDNDVITEASQALVALGYTQAEFNPILQKLGDVKTVEAAIKFALKEFARRS